MSEIEKERKEPEESQPRIDGCLTPEEFSEQLEKIDDVEEMEKFLQVNLTKVLESAFGDDTIEITTPAQEARDNPFGVAQFEKVMKMVAHNELFNRTTITADVYQKYDMYLQDKARFLRFSMFVGYLAIIGAVGLTVPAYTTAALLTMPLFGLGYMFFEIYKGIKARDPLTYDTYSLLYLSTLISADNKQEGITKAIREYIDKSQDASVHDSWQLDKFADKALKGLQMFEKKDK